MPHDRSLIASGARLVLVLIAAGSLGCFAHSRGEADWDEQPVINTGMGATILYPGQTAPTYGPSGSVAPAPGAAPPAPPGAQPAPPTPVGSGSAPTTQIQNQNGGERRSGSPQPGGLPITMIGGAEQDISGHQSWKQEPVWEKYLALPFAVLAAPFKALADSRKEAREPGPELPKVRPPDLGGAAAAEPPPKRRPPPRDYESAMVDQLERELAEREAHAAQEPTGAPSPPSAPRGLSIADELAALERGPSRPATPPAPEPAVARRAGPPSASGGGEADGIVDRDGDGRTDQWIYRDGGRIVRVALDENSDGRPDRTLYYDPESQAVKRVEEDADGDGVTDSWSDYADGHVARRRADADRDGVVDTWSFYEAGVITRHEQDSNGDGFRDRIGFYVAGKLVREERDRDADGVPDAAIHYDANERVSRREEDNDHDGLPDVVSHYEEGRLSRRELLDHGGASSGRP